MLWKFSSSPVFRPLNNSNPHTHQNVSRHCQVFARGQNYPWLSDTAWGQLASPQLSFHTPAFLLPLLRPPTLPQTLELSQSPDVKNGSRAGRTHPNVPPWVTLGHVAFRPHQPKESQFGRKAEDTMHIFKMLTGDCHSSLGHRYNLREAGRGPRLVQGRVLTFLPHCTD